MDLKFKKINLFDMYSKIYISLTLFYVFIFQFLKIDKIFLGLVIIVNIGMVFLALMKKKTTYYIGKNNILLIIITSYLFLSVMYSVDKISSLRFFINYIIAFIFFIVYINISKINKNKLLIKIISSISIIYSYISIMQLILGDYAIEIYSKFIKIEYVNAIYNWTLSDRITGIGIHPGVNAFVIAFGLYICLSSLKNRNKFYKAIGLINSMIMFVSILLTQNRNTLLAFIAIFIALNMYKVNITKKLVRILKYIILIFFILFIIKNMGVSFGTLERLFNENGQQAIYLRFILYSLAFELFKQNILFGSGINTFVYFTYLYNMPEKTHAHNMLLQLLAEIGMIGTLLIYIFFIINLVKTARMYKLNHTSSKAVYLKICIFAQLLFISSSITGNPLYEIRQLFIYFISISILYSLDYEN